MIRISAVGAPNIRVISPPASTAVTAAALNSGSTCTAPPLNSVPNGPVTSAMWNIGEKNSSASVRRTSIAAQHEAP